ncbi:hypothetical protein [Pseudomonas oryzihabitans]|uniref:hypothetical protein n=1 Tax=Pseudomonas oryzihabitans TaxID=47885 RepID=UPI00289401BA|nr:hypothetical protein [Pseudomonas oryzihabitans]MDT3717917.1 hypothetical protein [Pseudomonas oryzihabitans]
MRRASLLLSSAGPGRQRPAGGFSPAIDGSSALDVVTNGIDSAHYQALVAAYSFTSKPVAPAPP